MIINWQALVQRLESLKMYKEKSSCDNETNAYGMGV